MKPLVIALIGLWGTGLINMFLIAIAGDQIHYHYHQESEVLISMAPWIVAAFCALLSGVAFWDSHSQIKRHQEAADRRMAFWCAGMAVGGMVVSFFSLWAIRPWMWHVLLLN